MKSNNKQKKYDITQNGYQNHTGKRAYKTGLPTRLKAGIESLSGIAMDDVTVHYNSSKPAAIQAHAYTQGTTIYIAPGQEKQLPHEAWHVVQQKQGRVIPIIQFKGAAINDDPELEKEADVMGEKALQLITFDNKNLSRKTPATTAIQRSTRGGKTPDLEAKNPKTEDKTIEKEKKMLKPLYEVEVKEGDFGESYVIGIKIDQLKLEENGKLYVVGKEKSNITRTIKSTLLKNASTKIKFQITENEKGKLHIIKDEKGYRHATKDEKGNLQEVVYETDKFYVIKDENGKLYLVKREGVYQINKNQNKEQTSKKNVRVITEINDPHRILKKKYMLIEFSENIPEKDGIKVVNHCHLVKEDNIRPLAEYKDITIIDGKILPGKNDTVNISQKDVYQSALSDCPLQATLISIVHAHPETIKKLFTIEDGIVTVTFPGKPKTFGTGNDSIKVKMSRNLLLTPEGEPFYGGKKECYLWPAFIQKAWAIYNGGYSKIAMGKAFIIIEFITGKSIDFFGIRENFNEKTKIEDSWKVYDTLTEALKGRKPIVLTTGNWTDKAGEQYKNPKKEDHGGLGILHSYAILGIEKDKKDNKTYRKETMPDVKVTMRDPRDREGKTREIEFQKILDPEKVDNIIYVKSLGKETKH